MPGVVGEGDAAVVGHEAAGLRFEQHAVARRDGLVAGQADDLGLAWHLGWEQENALEQRKGTGCANDQIGDPDDRDEDRDLDAALHSARRDDCTEIHRSRAQVGVLLDGLHELGGIARVTRAAELHSGDNAAAQLREMLLDQECAGLEVGFPGEERQDVLAGVIDEQRNVGREQQQPVEGV